MIEFEHIISRFGLPVALLRLSHLSDNKKKFSMTRARVSMAKKVGVCMSAGESLSLAVNSYLTALADAVKKPAFSVTLGGREIVELKSRLCSLSLTDNRGFDADQLTLSIDDADGLIVLPPRGAELSVSLGWLGEPLTFKGKYIVDEVSHGGPPDVLGITARSADFRDEFNVKREVSWHDVTVERVISAIARRYDLTPMISELLMDIEIDHADQTDESDMSFLTRMADMLGAITTVKNGCLLFILPGGGVSASGKALPSITITRSSGDQHQFRVADRDAYTGVRAYWLDLNFGKKRQVKVKRRSVVRQEKSSGREGDYMEGSEGNVYVLRKTFQNETAARRAAAAKWIQLQKGAAQFSVTLARGRADLYPGMHATMSGFKSDIDNQDWEISRVEHVIDGSGYTTRLELEVKTSDWISETE